MPRDRDLCEVPRAQRQSLPKPLTDYAWMHPDRNEVIAAAYASGGYKLKAIGDYFGVHYAQSRIVRRMQDAKRFYDYYGSLGRDRCDVQWVRVTDSSTPLALAKLATVHSHLDLRRQATEAVNRAREILEVGTF